MDSACYSQKMEPNRSSGILLDENRVSVRYLDKAQDCLCRVTFDLTRKHHVLIDCLESLPELIAGPHSPTFHPEEPFQVFFPGDAGPIKCQISGTFNPPIIGDDPSVYLTLWPAGNDAFIDYGLQLLKVDGGMVNFNQYHIGIERTIRFDDGTWRFELTHVEESLFLYPAQIQNQTYLFTHHLLLQRRDARSFSWSQAQRALETLSTFLSFCAERWVAPALVTGFDQLGAVAMQDWRTARADPCGRRGSWLDEYHGVRWQRHSQVLRVLWKMQNGGKRLEVLCTGTFAATRIMSAQTVQ
jgi:hypothetical protein